MLDFIPDWTHLLPFLVAALTLNLTPGADMTYVMARSAGQGRVAGVVSSFGISAGSLVHSILAAIGLSALLASSPVLFLAIQYGGAAYLLRQSAGFARFMGRFSAVVMLWLAAYTVYTRRTIPG